MSFTDIFVRRPVLATVVSLLILLVGANSVWNLPVRQFPKVEDTTITITTSYPGANADQIKGFITTPLQQAVASTEGIDTLKSTSAQNVSTITMKLKLDADGDRALADVLSKINEVKSVLPEESKDPVVVRTTGTPYALMYMGFNSKTMAPAQISDYLDRVIRPQIQAIDGVAKAEILGGSTFAMRVWLNPDKMAALGITPLDVNTALAQNNFTTAAGSVKGDFTQQNINAKTSLETPEQFLQLVVAVKNNTIIRLGQIATVDLGPQNFDSTSAFDGLKAVFLGITTTPDANPLSVISAVRERFPDLQRQLPPQLQASIAYDATEFINASIWEVSKTLIEATLIVIVVIFLFLGNIRSTLVPVVTIPLSLVGVAIFLLALGYSINLLTLLAFVLAIGLVVDDAIVVVENIHRHIEDGMTPFESALAGAREIAGPVITMTLTLAAVYAPIGFTSGLTGALFREFAFTLAGAVVVSGLVALTLSPMMCSKIFKQHAQEGRFEHLIESIFGAVRRFYSRRLEGAMKQRPVFALMVILIVALSGILYTAINKELAPSEDQGVLFSFANAPEHTNLDYLQTYADKVTQTFMDVPERQNVFSIVGMGSVHAAFVGLIVKPWEQRERSDTMILGELQGKLGAIPGVKTFATAPSAIPIGAGELPVEFIIKTPGDYTKVAEVLDKIDADAKKSGLFIFTNTDLRFETPQAELIIDKDKANQLGVRMSDIGATLAVLLGGNNVNRINIQGRSYEVIAQVPRAFRGAPQKLLDYQLRTTGGDMVPLSSFIKLDQTVQPNSLATFQQLNSATFQGAPFPGRTVGEAVAFLQQKAQEYFPQNMTYDWQGESRQFVTEGNTLAYTFLFALIVIYLVLAAQFESFRDPFIILIGLPASMFGALFFLFIMGEVNGATQGQLGINLGSGTVNIYTQIGLVTLIGLISKHGILMVEFANKLQEEQNYDKFAAIKEAAAVRLRPILMTTAAMVIGVVPLLIAAGAGAKSRFDIGLVIAAGMTVGTMFTLFITPVVYTYIAADRRPKEALAAPKEALAAAGATGHAGHAPVVAQAANDRDDRSEAGKTKRQRDRRPPPAEAAE